MKSTSQLRVAFIGCGNIALEYVNVYCSLPWVSLALCVDIDESLARRTADRCHAIGSAAPAVSTRFEDALHDDIDLIVINTPNDLHCPQAVAALRAGKHVLLQKPLATSVEDSEIILAAAREAPACKVGMYMSYLDQPLLHDMRSLVRAGYYGEVVEFYGRSMHSKGMLWARQAREGNSSWRNSVQRTGGGCFIQLAVHYIYLAKWILDTRIVEVSASMANLHSAGLEGEDLGMATMKTASGARIVLSTAWCANGDQLSITGTEGASDYLYNSLFLTAPHSPFAFAGKALHMDAANQARQSRDILSPGFGDVSNPLNQHRRFLEAVRDGREPDVSLEDALCDMRVLEACYRSAATDAPVSVHTAAEPLLSVAV